MLTRKIPRLCLVDNDDGDRVDAHRFTAGLPFQVIANKLFISGMKSKPRSKRVLRVTVHEISSHE